MTKTDYHPNIPKQCPPTTASPAQGDFYRGIRKPPISDTDFLSHVEREMDNSDPENCEHWGLSGWTSEAAVKHARLLNKYMRKWHIAKGTVSNSDGAMLATGGAKNPGHCTFWKAHGKSIASRFAIVMQPTST